MIGNIIINKNDAFGNVNYEIIRALLYMVDRNMMDALGQPYSSTRQCVIVPTEDVPMCSKVGDLHWIFLKTKENYWCQWVYQFAHEYCHHLIDGSLSGEWSDVLWFEETICELSSLYNLNKMIGFCVANGLQWYAPSVLDYLKDLLTENNKIFNLSTDGGWYGQYEVSLREVKYQRELYNAIAVLMFPLFIENPSLWKLILTIGDIRSWATLDELFGHLEAFADDSYRVSLDKLVKMFS